MILECSREKIKNAISAAERVTGKNLSLPVLSNIILETKDRVLQIKATNLDLGLTISLPIPGKTSQTGTIAVNGSILANFFNNFPTTEETIKLELVAGNLIISSRQHATTVNGYPSDDFPLIPTIANPGSFLVDSHHLMSTLKDVWSSAAVSNLKPEISSVCFYEQEDGLVVVATDSFRLAEKRLLNNKISLPNLIVPLKNVSEIIKILDNISGEVEVQYNQHQISFQAENFYLTSRLIEGVFPDYRQIIPTRYETEVVVKRGDLLDLLKLSNVFTNKFNQADLTVTADDKNQIEIKTKNDNGDNRSWLPAQSVTGSSVSIGFNLKYLLEGLAAIRTENVVLRLNGDSKPIVVAGVGDTSFTYLIMPIRR